MTTLLKWVSKKLKKTSLTEEEKYLSQATSLEDLERRQRLLAHGKAPHQTNYQYYFDIHNGGAF